MSTEARYSMFDSRNKYPKDLCSEGAIMVANTVKEFVEKEVFLRRLDLEGGWHRDEELALDTRDYLYKQLVDLGNPENGFTHRIWWVGVADSRHFARGEELTRGDAGLALHAVKPSWFALALLAADRQDMLEQFAEKLTGSDAWTACIAMSEREGGINVEDPTLEGRSIKTIARDEGDEYVINGQKTFPSPGGPPEVFSRDLLKGHLGYLVLATTDPSKGTDGVGIFYVPSDAKGLSFSKPIKKMGLVYTDRNVEYFFEDVRIPKENRLVGPGKDWKIFKGTIIGYGRIYLAMGAVGVAQAALEICLEWMKEREIAGKPVREHSLFASIIGKMVREIDLVRMYILSVGSMTRYPEVYGELGSPRMFARISAAKSRATETAVWVTDKVIELMGGHGYSFENLVEKYYRDIKADQIGLGTPYRELLDVALSLYSFKWNRV